MKQEPECAVLELDTVIYSLEAIRNASYDFAEKANVRLEQLNSGKIQVCLIPRSSFDLSVDSLTHEFYDLLLDHQIRLTISEDTKVIREIIVAQAFEPCDNLQEIIEAVRP